MLLPPPAARQTLLLLLFVLGLPFTSGCSSDRPGFENKTVPPMTDTAAIYQVHGIRFAVPEGLVPVTDRYVFTDLEPGKDPLFDPYNEITLFVDEDRSPEEILADVMDGFDNLYDGPHLHNQRRTRVNGRMVTQASITYTPRNRRDPDEPEDTVRVDYALIPNQDGGETWGFRLVPPDTTLTPEVAQDWADMVNSAKAAPQTSPPWRIGFEMQQGQRRFRTGHYILSVPKTWHIKNSFVFVPETMTSSKPRLNNVASVDKALISVSIERGDHASTPRDVSDLKKRFSSFDADVTVKKRLLEGMPTEWIEYGFNDHTDRVRMMARDINIYPSANSKSKSRVSISGTVEYVIDDTATDSPHPPELQTLFGLQLLLYESILAV